jgi:hypothetical protein
MQRRQTNMQRACVASWLWLSMHVHDCMPDAAKVCQVHGQRHNTAQHAYQHNASRHLMLSLTHLYCHVLLSHAYRLPGTTLRCSTPLYSTASRAPSSCSLTAPHHPSTPRDLGHSPWRPAASNTRNPPWHLLLLLLLLRTAGPG